MIKGDAAISLQTSQSPWNEWLEDASRGDRTAFFRLYQGTRSHLFGLALRILKRKDWAEEALQDSFLKIWNKAADFDPERGQAYSWMAAIVRNRCLDQLRKAGREPVSREELREEINADLVPDSLEQLVGAEQIQALQKCLETLGKEERESIWLAYWKGLTQVELAEFWEKPLGTVKTWVRRGLERLRGCLES